MYKIFSIAKREFKSYFDSPIAYIVIILFLLGSGWMVFNILFHPNRDIADLRIFFNPSPFSPALLLVGLASVVTMRLVAEERKIGTIELLTTMPVRDGEVIVGKFLAALALTAVAILSTIVYAICVDVVGDLDWGPVISGYVGMLLFTAALVAIGLMCSTWTDSQIVSVIIAVAISASLFYLYWLHFFMPDFLVGFVEFISLSSHLENMARGVIDSRDVLYYLTLTCGALFIAERSLARQHV